MQVVAHTLDLEAVEVDPTWSDRDLWIERFLAQPDWRKSLAIWCEAEGRCFRSARELSLAISAAIAMIDQRISDMLNMVLHSPKLQRLESSWRGLKYLLERTTPGSNVQIAILNVSWRELSRDVESAMDYTHTQLYRRVHTEAFDTPGGRFFSLLIGDYHIRHTTDDNYPTDDLNIVRNIAEVAADCFAPFIISASPQFLGLEDFAQLERSESLGTRFTQSEYARWNEFRRGDTARFVGLTVPRIVLRPPWEFFPRKPDGFRFTEACESDWRSLHLWGGAAWGFAAVLIRSFEQTGWFLDIRGVRDRDSGGVVRNLPSVPFDRALADLPARPVAEVLLTERRERELMDLGIIPLCHLPHAEGAAFFTNASVQLPKTYTTTSGTLNARLSAMLQYVLCVCRVGHYVKVMARNKIGSFNSANELELFLQAWISSYVADDENASGTTKSRFPLKQAEVKVLENASRPGAYQCAMYLIPHSQWDAMTTHIQLRTDVRTAQR